MIAFIFLDSQDSTTYINSFCDLCHIFSQPKVYQFNHLLEYINTKIANILITFPLFQLINKDPSIKKGLESIFYGLYSMF